MPEIQEMQAVDLTPEVPFQEEIKDAVHQAETALEVVGNYEIANGEAYLQAAEDLKEIKGRVNTLTKQRKKLTGPLDESKAAIMDFFRGPLDCLARAEEAIKAEIGNYNRREDEKRRQIQAQHDATQKKEAERLARRAAKAEEKGNEEKAAELQQRSDLARAAVITTPAPLPKVKGLSTKKIWRWRVTDKSLIPLEYMVTNDTLLGSLSRSTKGAVPVPGIEFYSEDIIAAGRA